MPDFDWPTFLQEFAAELLADDEVRESQLEEVVASGWLGFPGATAEELKALEARLGTTLPPSYRGFLEVSNGWRTTGRFEIQLWSAGEVGWLCDIDPQLIEIWTSIPHPPIPDEAYFVYGGEQRSIDIRTEYLRDMLAISSRDWANQDQLWLNPRVVFEGGEWEAWHFSTEYPGASRHRSFRELMERERRVQRFIKDA
jgi:hypothetical protein